MSLAPVNTMVYVDRPTCILKLYRRPLHSVKFRIAKRYRVAVGMVGHETPRGLYLVSKRAKDPDWCVPDSQWAIDAGLIPGTIIPGGDPANPIVGRWLEIYDGAGIHGTRADDSIGSAASHGCIRMHVDDVEELYPHVRKGCPVFIV